MGDAVRTIFKLSLAFCLGVMAHSCIAPGPGSGMPAAAYQPTPPPPAAPYDLTYAASLKVDFKDGSCSGVKVGDHTAITAFHCFKDDKFVGINGVPMRGEVIANDGYDHVLLVVEDELPGKAVKIAPHVPPPGTQVYTWGNPGATERQLRIGHVAGVWVAADGTFFHTYDLNNWHGDSGGPIFNMQGELVAIHYGYYYDTTPYGASFRLTLSEPFHFTEAQLRGIK